MHKTYEAVYEGGGHLRWIGGHPPDLGRRRVLVTVLEERGPEEEEATQQRRDRADVRRMLEETRGGWGADKSLEEVSAEARRLREEWDRLDRDRTT